MIVKRTSSHNSNREGSTRIHETSSSSSPRQRLEGLLSNLQNRLLLPMSIFDIFNSIALGLSTTPIPKGSPCTYGAMGNQTTCAMQGFMMSLGLGLPSYNAMLCLYYYCVLKLNMSDNEIKKFEPYMHAYASIPTIIVAIVPTIFSLYNNNVFYCAIESKWRYQQPPPGYVPPNNMETIELISSILHIHIIVTTLVNALIIAFCMISIYCTARGRQQRLNSIQSSTFSSSFTSIRHLRASIQSQTSTTPATTRPTTRSSIIHRPTATTRPSSSHRDLTTDTKQQAMIYVGGYIIAWILPMIPLIIDMMNKPLPIALQLIVALFFPSQGIWNFLGFIRPRFKMTSELYPHKSMFQKLMIVVFDKMYEEDDSDHDSEVGAANAVASSSISGSGNEWLRVLKIKCSVLLHRIQTSLFERKSNSSIEVESSMPLGIERETSIKMEEGAGGHDFVNTASSTQRNHHIKSPKNEEGTKDLEKLGRKRSLKISFKDDDHDDNDDAANDEERGKKIAFPLKLEDDKNEDREEEEHESILPTFDYHSLSSLVAQGFKPNATSSSIKSERRRQRRRHSTMNIQPLSYYGIEESGENRFSNDGNNGNSGEENLHLDSSEVSSFEGKLRANRPQRRHSTTGFSLLNKTSASSYSK